MDTRSEAFVRKFSSAQSHLGASRIQEITSLKDRGDCASDGAYAHFIRHCEDRFGWIAQQVQGDFQGRAWLVSDRGGNKVILIEHETGLEVLLSDVGSVASILGLGYIIWQEWRRSRDRHYGIPCPRDDRGHVEIRTLNAENVVISNAAPSIESFVATAIGEENRLLKARVSALEADVAGLKQARERTRSSPKRTRKSGKAGGTRHR